MGRSIGGSANRVSAMVAVVALVGACGSSEVPSATSTPPPQSSALPSPISSPSQAPLLEAAQPASVEIGGQLFLAGLTGEHEQYYIIRDGQGESFFEADGCHPCVSVSPDARYVSHPWITPSDQFSAAVYDVTTRETVELAVPAGFTALGPGAFSPDGERIARHGSSDADPTVDGIYTSKLDGSDVRLVSRVTDGRGRDPLWWSPDGAWILVWSEDPAATSQRHLGDLYLVRADGGEERRINPSDTSVRARPA